MSGIYIHIPFCKKACHYCDFHFSTSLKKKDEMILALANELKLRSNACVNEEIETIYFGGGTPSILSIDDLNFLLETVFQNYKVAKNPEITLEANPDDLSFRGTRNLFSEMKEIGINRLSIGIQSFFEDDLKMMNRAHNAEEASKCLEFATQYFDNISLDLIYGIPGSSNQKWKENIEKAVSFGINHISSYALTVEPKTALETFIKKGIIKQPDDEVAQEQFDILVETLTEKGFIHYELSNFGKPNYFSKNNSAYWLGKKYIGIGPSAHSFDGECRSWNIANNTLYLKSLQENKLPTTSEKLSDQDKYNEYIMTGLRTIWGVSLKRIQSEFGEVFLDYLIKHSKRFIADDLLSLENEILTTTKKGKFLTDGIASDLFMLN